MPTYKHAIVRQPSHSIINGITTEMFSSGKPDYDAAMAQHANYISCLKNLGLNILTLPALEAYPDACFVEDPAVVMAECAIVARSTQAIRAGEMKKIIPALKTYYANDQIFHITAPGSLEGGDVLQVDKHFYVGLSDRTNIEGAQQFEAIVAPFGYKVTTVPVTEGLHLKDFAIYLDHNDLLVSPTMNEQPAFADFNRHVIADDEQYAINSLYINGSVIVPEGNPKTKALIKALGYPVVDINTDAFKKIDGSLTCLSLRF